MIIAFLIKPMPRIYMKQNINILLKHTKNGVANLKDPKPFIVYLNNMQDASKNTTQTENVMY